MSVNSVGGAAVATTDRPSTSRVEDTTNADRFAGMFATAVHGTRSAERPVLKREGTSELDRAEAKATDEKSDAAEEKEEKKIRTRSRTISRSSTNDVVRTMDALDPQLQDKLARVMARVQSETGHTVTVAETFRSQDRQDMLFAQGRETEGNVVTWTRNSKHTQGRAVDVVLDGGNASSEAYQALQRIANEEGLRTLGARDPGHLELRGKVANTDLTSLIPDAPADALARGQNQSSIARVADVARVAEVAKVADVAPVAQVAPAGVMTQSSAITSSTKSEGTSTTSASQVVASAIRAAAAKHTDGGSAFDGGSRGDSREQSGDSSNGYALFGSAGHRDHSANAFSLSSVAAPTGSDAVARTERILAALDATPARQLSNITMNLDNANGSTDRISLSMRGATLDTSIATSDNRVAQLLNAKSDELAKALSKDGIELRELRVRSATDTNTVTAAAASHSSNQSGDASNHSRFDRGQAWQRQQDQQEQFERQRSQQRGRQQRQWRGDDQ